MDQKHTNYKDLDENLAWLTQKTEEPKCNKGNFTFPQHTQEMQLNSKVIKKWQPTHFYINPLFMLIPPFLATFLVPPQVTQFLEGPNTPPPLL